jgi:deazaflavin-dependent oxidoreductase (nitroreductase family)
VGAWAAGPAPWLAAASVRETGAVVTRVGNPFDRLRLVRRLVGPVEAAQVRRFGRSGLSTVLRTPVLVLETTGRRSGARRATALAYHRGTDGALYVVGGAGGQARLPDWVANLRVDARAAVVVDRTRRPVLARELEGPDRAAAWEVLRRVWPRIERYERRAGRPVPVVRLDPA